MMMYDRKDINGTELRDCSVELDGKKVVDRGRLSAELC